MEENIAKNKISNNTGMVHIVLSHSYSVFMFMIVVSFILDSFFYTKIFNESTYLYAQYIALLFMVIGSILIYWAQNASSHSKKEMLSNNTDRKFAHGPYKYSRNPTHIGLLFLTLGLGLVFNSLIITLCMVLSFIITKIIFIKKEESLLSQTYGHIYEDYKKKVRAWI